MPGAHSKHVDEFADPSAATGSEAERLRVFDDIRRQITTRLHTWVLAIKER